MSGFQAGATVLAPSLRATNGPDKETLQKIMGVRSSPIQHNHAARLSALDTTATKPPRSERLSFTKKGLEEARLNLDEWSSGLERKKANQPDEQRNSKRSFLGRDQLPLFRLKDANEKDMNPPGGMVYQSLRNMFPNINPDVPGHSPSTRVWPGMHSQQAAVQMARQRQQAQQQAQRRAQSQRNPHHGVLPSSSHGRFAAPYVYEVKEIHKRSPQQSANQINNKQTYLKPSQEYQHYKQSTGLPGSISQLDGFFDNDSPFRDAQPRLSALQAVNGASFNGHAPI